MVRYDSQKQSTSTISMKTVKSFTRYYFLFIGTLIGTLIGNGTLYKLLPWNKIELTSVMSIESKGKLVSATEKLNKLISEAKKSESEASTNPSRKSEYLARALASRNEIANTYAEMATILSNDLSNITSSDIKMEPLAKTLVTAFQESSVITRKTGAALSEFHPSNIYYIRS
jgi:hypothetical protein